jgi:uncharacterized protein HemY
MKTLLLALLALMFSVLVTLLLREDSGYVLLSYRQWTLESSLALFLLLDLLLFAAPCCWVFSCVSGGYRQECSSGSWSGISGGPANH